MLSVDNHTPAKLGFQEMLVLTITPEKVPVAFDRSVTCLLQ